MEEERMYQDTPMYRAGWDFEELIFGDHPLGWDTIGTEELIMNVTQSDFQKHKDDLYCPNNLVATFAGNITDAESKELSEKYFAPISGETKRPFEPFKEFGTRKVYLRDKNTEQSHLVIGVPSVGSQDKDHFAHKVLSIILGGNMSSRMFLNIREAKGLCYYISTDTDSYLDTGALSTRAGVDQSRLHEALKLIQNEYAIIAKDGITPEELDRAKSYFKGKIALSLEDSEELAHFYGKQKLLYPNVFDIDDYFQAIEGVTKEQVDALATRILTPEAMRLVVIGKGQKEEELERILA